MEDEDESFAALQTELLLAIQGLGNSTDGVFTPNSRALERLRELDTALRKDTPERQYVHFYLGQKQALQTHVIPLAIACNNEAPVIFLCLKIFTRLTMALPANVDNYLQRLTQLHDAKQAIISGDVIAVLMSWMGELFTNAPSERKKVDNDSLELFCSLFKNLLAIPNPSRALASSLSEWDLNLQDRCILKLGEEHVLNALVTLSESCSEKKVVQGCEGVRHSVSLMLLQCFYYLYKNETEEDLQGGSISSVNADLVKAGKGGLSEKELLVQRLMVHQKKQVEENFLRTRGQSSRHSRFGTMIVQSSQLGPRAQLVRNVFSSNDLATDLYTDDGSSRKLCPDVPPRVYFSDRVRQILLETAELLLTRGGYNELMSTMLSWLQSETATALPEDAVFLIHVSCVLMGVHRFTTKRRMRKAEKKKEVLGFTVKDIQATVNQDAFNFLMSRVQQCFTVKPTDYATLAICMSAYKEVVRCVYEMTFHGDEETKLEAGEMRGVLFDSTENVGLLPRCFKMYTAQRNNTRYLTYLVHAAHFSTRILTYMAKTGHKVQSKRRKKQKKTINSDLMLDLEDGYAAAPRVNDEPAETGAESPKKKKRKAKKKSEENSNDNNSNNNNNQEETKEDDSAAKREEETEETETKVGEEESAQASERTLEETSQATETELLREESLSLHVTQTEEGEEEQKTTEEPAEQTLQEEEETKAETNEAEAEEKEVEAEEKEAEEEKVAEDEGDERETRGRRKAKKKSSLAEWEYDEEEGFDEEFSRREHVFNLEQYVSNYIHHQVIRSYCQLLSHYKDNSLETNGCILKFFELISAEPYRMSGLFFQLSVLVLFDQILMDETIHHDKNFATLRQFCKNIVRRFFDLSVDNSLLFLEALWLKTPQHAEQLLEPFKILTSQELMALREEQEYRRELERQMEDDADMQEAGFDESTTWVPRPQNVPVSAPKIRWSKADDAILVKEYPVFKDLPECLDMLASLFQPARSAASVKRRLKLLGLTHAQRDEEEEEGGGGGEEESAPKPVPLPSAWDLHTALAQESKETVSVLVSLLERCASFRDEPAVDLALVPTTAVEWQVLESASAVLSLVGCLSPESGRVFWRVPAALNIAEVVALLGDAQEGAGEGEARPLKRARKSRLKKLHEEGEEEEEEEEDKRGERGEEEEEGRAEERRVPEGDSQEERGEEPPAAKRKKRAVVAEDEDEVMPETDAI